MYSKATRLSSVFHGRLRPSLFASTRSTYPLSNRHLTLTPENRASLPSNYGIIRGGAEADRLNYQHRMWVQNLGYLIHPSLLPCVSGDAPHTADVGTGTGIFPIALADILPVAASIDGFDISAAQFAPPERRPPNVSLTTHDARTPFPAHLHGRYDLVTLRTLAVGLDAGDWRRIVENCAQLLRTGGGLQWIETDLTNLMQVRGGGPEAPVEALGELCRGFRDGLKERFRHGWCELPELFRETGLEDVKLDVCASDRVPETRRALTDIGIEGMWSWVRRTMENGTCLWSEEEARDLRRRCEEERDRGVYTRFDFYVTTGKKRG